MHIRSTTSLVSETKSFNGADPTNFIEFSKALSDKVSPDFWLTSPLFAVLKINPKNPFAFNLILEAEISTFTLVPCSHLNFVEYELTIP